MQEHAQITQLCMFDHLASQNMQCPFVENPTKKSLSIQKFTSTENPNPDMANTLKIPKGREKFQDVANPTSWPKLLKIQQA